MPTLNYVSMPPQSRLVARAKIHLLVWSILFFCIASMIGVFAAILLYSVLRDVLRGRPHDNVLLGAGIVLVIIGSFAYLFVKSGLDCTRAYIELNKGNPSLLRTAITKFAILAALCLFWTLGTAVFLVVPAILYNQENSRDANNWREVAFWAVIVEAGFILLTLLIHWTKRSLSRAEDSFESDTHPIELTRTPSDPPPPHP